MGRKKKAISRTEIITVRFDPKLRYAADLGARQFRRTLSAFIELAVKEVLTQLRYDKEKYHILDLKSAGRVEKDNAQGAQRSMSILELADKLWDAEESDRLTNLAQEAPNLLTVEEQRIWKAIKEDKRYWRSFENEIWYDSDYHEPFELRVELVRKDWDEIVERAEKLPLMMYFEEVEDDKNY